MDVVYHYLTAKFPVSTTNSIGVQFISQALDEAKKSFVTSFYERLGLGKLFENHLAFGGEEFRKSF